MKTMKFKAKHILWVLVASLMAFASCSSDNTTTNSDDEDENLTPSTGEKITITIGMPETSTKSTKVTYNDGIVEAASTGDAVNALLWEATDTLIFVGYSHRSTNNASTYKGESKFVLTSGAGTSSATFEGETVEGATYYSVFLKNKLFKKNSAGTAYQLAVSNVQMDTVQVQNSFGTADHLKDYLWLQKVGTTATSVTGTRTVTSENITSGFTMTLGSGIMKFVLKGIPSEVGTLSHLRWKRGTAVPSAYNTSNTDGASSTSWLYFKENAVTFSSSVDSITAYMLYNGATKSVMARGRFCVTLVNTNGDEYMARMFNNTTSTVIWELGARYEATFDGATWTKLGDSIVDLGLNVEWATKNIGATSPEDYGKYFQWGELTPQTSYASAGSDYSYLNQNIGTTNGTSYYYIVADATYDVAKALWGGGFRMPFPSTAGRLLATASTTKTAETLNGVAGVRFTSSVAGYTTKSIFIPFAGAYAPTASASATSPTGTTTVAALWTGMAASSTNAYYWGYNGSTSANVASTSVRLRYQGLPIRPMWY